MRPPPASYFSMLMLFRLQDGSFELRVFVDGHLVESFFNGAAVISSVTANQLPGDSLTSELVLTLPNAKCSTNSWAVGL